MVFLAGLLAGLGVGAIGGWLVALRFGELARRESNDALVSVISRVSAVVAHPGPSGMVAQAGPSPADDMYVAAEDARVPDWMLEDDEEVTV